LAFARSLPALKLASRYDLMRVVSTRCRQHAICS